MIALINNDTEHLIQHYAITSSNDIVKNLALKIYISKLDRINFICWNVNR